MTRSSPVKTLALLAALTAGFSPGFVRGQETRARDMSDVLLRVNGPMIVNVGDVANTVAVINGTAVINGHLREQLFVVNGNAKVNGQVDGGIMVTSGTVELGPAARVGGDVVTYSGRIIRAPGATVIGKVVEEQGVSMGRDMIRYLWFAFTMTMVLAMLLFATVGAEQLSEARALVRQRTGATVLSALITVVLVPTLAAIAFLSVVALPAGFALLMLVLPALAVLGYLVTAAAAGAWLTDALKVGAGRYGSAVIGVLVLQIFALVPVIGGLAVLFASQLGAGALLLRVWEHRTWLRNFATPQTLPASV